MVIFKPDRNASNSDILGCPKEFPHMTEYLQEISGAVGVISTFDKKKTESQLIQGKMSTFI
jgi:hypothetical protein